MDIKIDSSLSLEQIRAALKAMLTFANMATTKSEFLSTLAALKTEGPLRCEGCSQGDYCPDPNCPG